MITTRRNTIHKERIRALFGAHHALRASDVAELLPDVPVSTVFRNLEKFADDGMLRTITLGSNGVFYESVTHTHDHFVCDGCDTVRAIDLPKRTLEHVLPRGAHAHEGSIVIHGHCNTCAHLCHQ